jgi:hypothetical protein
MRGELLLSGMSQADTDLTARLPVTPETRDELRARKQGTERYDDVLQRLMSEADKSGDGT